MKIEFIGKSLLIDNKILVIGDLHLGYEGSLRESGYRIPFNIFEKILEDLDLIFEGVGKVDKVVLLGDVKHVFGKYAEDEWKEIGEVMNYLRRKVKEVIIVKGNHDAIIDSMIKKFDKVKLVNYYLWKDFAFLHGDKDFKEAHGNVVKNWIIGHAHPAIILHEKGGGVKKEKYKCFLEGKFRGKKVIIVPSFFDVNEGTDVRSYDLGLAWKFNLNKFEVKVVGESEGGLESLDFGKLGKL